MMGPGGTGLPVMGPGGTGPPVMGPGGTGLGEAVPLECADGVPVLLYGDILRGVQSFLFRFMPLF